MLQQQEEELANTIMEEVLSKLASKEEDEQERILNALKWRIEELQYHGDH